MSSGPRLGVEGEGFIDEHDRDTLLYGVAEAARLAVEGGFIGAIAKISTTPGTYQDLEQVG